MKRISILLSALFMCLFANMTVFADELLTAKPEFTYDGKSLAEYAELDGEPFLRGSAAYALNLNTGTVVFQKNCHDPVYPASTTKLMTAIVAYENIPNLDVEITASAQAVKKTSGSNVRIEAGDVYTARELLYALLVSGANDAALVLAEHVAGSEEEFCALMNEKAKLLGADNTHYDNVTGFHVDTTVTTARDTGIIAQYFYYIPELFKMSDTTRYDESETLRRILVNRNLLLSRATTDEYYYSRADGMSVGSTPEGGHCIVSTVTGGDGQIYLCVVMNSVEENDVNYAYKDIAAVFNYCLENFSFQTVASTNEVVCEIKVNNAVDIDHVALFPDKDIKMLLPNNLDYNADISIERRIFSDETDAPVNRFDQFGELVVKYKGDVSVGHAKLVSDVSVDKSNVLYFFSRIEKIVSGTWFVVFVITAAILFALYFGLSVYYKYFRKNKYTGNRPRNIRKR